jgi:glutamyl-tRNA reductase
MSKVLELKWIIEKNLNEQLDIIQKILSLSEEESSEFIDWYNSNQTRKAIEDICGAVESRTMGHTKAKKSGIVFLGRTE